MILKKTLPQSASGITTQYHKIDSVSLRDNQLRCHIESYVDIAPMNAKKPANYYSFCFDVTDAELNSTYLYTIIYNKITAMPDWSGAVIYSSTNVVNEEV